MKFESCHPDRSLRIFAKVFIPFFMKSILGNKESFVSYSVAFLFILIMIGTAMIYGDKEIILPEVAALSVGILAFRENKWLY